MNTHGGRVCRVAGTPFDVGYAVGQLLGSRLEANIARYIRERDPHPAPDGRSWQDGALPWLRTLPRRYQDEFEGIALGSGLPLQRVAEWPYVEVSLASGCTSALVTLGGRVWVARNNDYAVPDLWGHATIKEFAGRIPTITFGMEGDVFAGTGANRERLWLHYHYLPARDTPPPDEPALPCYVFLVEALETCRTLADVEALLETTPRDGSMLLFAVDGKDSRFALYECDGQAHRRQDPTRGFLAGTNHRVLEGQDASRRDTGPLSSVSRYARIASLMPALAEASASPDPARDLMAALADDGVEARRGDSVTVYANVACPETGELWYTLGGYPAASQGDWQRIAWPWWPAAAEAHLPALPDTTAL